MNPLIIIFIILLLSSTQCSFASIDLEVTKHPSINHYLTRLRLGDSSPLNLIVDLSGPFLWTHHGLSGLVTGGSIDCLTANGVQNPTSTSCSLTTTNPITKNSVLGDLVIGELRFDEPEVEVDRFLYVSMPDTLTGVGLPDGVGGVLGLGRKSRVSMHSQVSHSLSLERRFSVCLSGEGKKGFVSFGEKKKGLDEIKRSMVYSPMVSVDGKMGNSYYVKVNSIEINGRKLVMSPAKARLSSVLQYTTFGQQIYHTFIRAFEEEVAVTDASRMKRVSGVGEFELCYGKTEKKGKAEVPMVEFVMQSEMVRWRFHGGNVMVDVGNETMCLGVVEGDDDDDEIVVGGNMLEENLVEFDLESLMVGFSGSLLRRGTSCEDLGEKIALDGGRREIGSI